MMGNKKGDQWRFVSDMRNVGYRDKQLESQMIGYCRLPYRLEVRISI